jgi:hypothetical protein
MSDPSFTSAEKAVKEIEAQVRRIVERFANRVGNLLVAETVNVLDASKRNATGELRKSITYELTIFGTFVKIIVFSPLEYAFYSHYGRAPGTPPPIWKIRDWVRTRRLAGRYSVKTPPLGKRTIAYGGAFPTGAYAARRQGNRMNQYWEDDAIARAIQWKIAKYGTREFHKTLHFFDFALKQALPKIERDYKAMMA